jgi:hypothetical protein
MRPRRYYPTIPTRRAKFVVDALFAIAGLAAVVLIAWLAAQGF